MENNCLKDLLQENLESSFCDGFPKDVEELEKDLQEMKDISKKLESVYYSLEKKYAHTSS